MGGRRKAREYAVQTLYMYELRLAENENPNDMLRDAINLSSSETSDEEKGSAEKDKAPLNKAAYQFAVSLIEGTMRERRAIDEVIARHLKHWEPERLNLIDRVILRMSVFAMLYMPDIPPTISINEGIELAKLYGTENSSHFINGVLDAVYKFEIKSTETKRTNP